MHESRLPKNATERLRVQLGAELAGYRDSPATRVMFQLPVATSRLPRGVELDRRNIGRVAPRHIRRVHRESAVDRREADSDSLH